VGALGERLKREREKRKITLEEVALATKVGSRYLRAIEEEKFDQLPGGIFNKGFVKSYARHLGLNGDQAVADYEQIFRATHPEELTPADPDAEGRKILEQRVLRVKQERTGIEQLPWGKAAVALLLFAFAVAVWGAYSHFKKPAAATHATAAVSEANLPASAPRAVSKPSTKRTVPVAEKRPAPAPARLEDVVETVADAPGTFRVAIYAREDSWIHIQADGKDILEDTLPAEGQRSIQAANQLVIKAGNIGALDFWFNGQKVPVQGGLDQVKTISFDSSGLVTPLPKTQAVAATIER
jgi:cytoskeleton protein RodZ